MIPLYKNHTKGAKTMKAKRILSILLTGSMLLSLLPVSALAATPVFDAPAQTTAKKAAPLVQEADASRSTEEEAATRSSRDLDAENGTAESITIQLNAEGKPAGSSVDGNWYYDPSSGGRLYLYNGGFTLQPSSESGAESALQGVELIINQDADFADGTVGCWANNAGIISGGTFQVPVNNNKTISGGTFQGEVYNDSTISGGTFQGGSYNFRGTISNGTFQGILRNDSGTISGGNGIISNDIDLSGSLELTAKAGSPNGKALSQNGIELDPNTFKEKLDPGANIITKDADGKVIDQVPIPRPVEPEKPVIPEESSSSSDGGSSAPSAPASSLPGLTVTDKDGQRISYTSTQSGNTLTVCVGRFTASFRISLAALRQLRAEGIETITFQTILCSTTLSVDELLAMGGEDAEIVLTHHIRSSTLTVGGKAV